MMKFVRKVVLALLRLTWNKQECSSVWKSTTKKGVVSHQEYETAKTAITERFARQRLELAGKYAPEKLLRANLNDELAVIEELKKAGQLTGSEANTAELQLKFDYAQNRAQSAVNPLDQLRALYDPQQELINQQTQELAQLQAFNDQKLITEEEFQQRKQQIIEKYKNDKIQKEMESYATGLNDLGALLAILPLWLSSLQENNLPLIKQCSLSLKHLRLLKQL